MADEIVAAGGELRARRRRSRAIRFAAGGAVAVAGGRRALDGRRTSSPRCRCATSSAIAEPRRPARRCSRRPPGLRYRDFICVALVARRRRPLPRQLDLRPRPRRRASGGSRTSAPGARDLVPDADRTCLGLEYFCFEGDELWNATDDELVARATGELERDRARASAARSSPGTSCACRRPTRSTTPSYERPGRDRCAAGSTGSTDLVADRPQRPAPLQQLRPLDADRDARGRERSATAPATTSGR